MNTEIRKLKHTAKLQQWTKKILECRSSGESVKAWCEHHAIGVKTYYYWEKEFLLEQARTTQVPAVQSSGPLVRISPNELPSAEVAPAYSGIVIRHGENTIELPIQTAPEQIAALICALNRHA